MLTRQMRRFLATGLLATGVHFVVATASIELLRLQPAPANAVAFVAATIASYLVNTLWSFSSAISGVTLYRFSVVQLLGVVLAAMVSGGVDLAGFHYVVGILAVPVFVTPVTYSLHRAWTYKSRRDGEELA